MWSKAICHSWLTFKSPLEAIMIHPLTKAICPFPLPVCSLDDRTWHLKENEIQKGEQLRKGNKQERTGVKKNNTKEEGNGISCFRL